MNIAPVVIIVFNRPDETRQVFEKIRLAKPSKLYVIADAPRKNNNEDKKLCAAVLEIFKEVDWNCEIKINAAKENMGVGPRPHSGISWVFEHEDRAIILEDDCLPSLSFFSFCTELLEKYFSEERIMHISGTRFCEEFSGSNNDSYIFSIYQNNSGWATWKRAWKFYDFEMGNYEMVKSRNYLSQFFNNDELAHWYRKFDRAFKERHRIWDYQWQYAIFTNSGICIFPQKNLISNIGPYGATINYRTSIYFRNYDEGFSITVHPLLIIANRKFDKYYYKKHLNPGISFFSKILGKITKKILMIIPNRIVKNKMLREMNNKRNSFYNKNSIVKK
jgi:hypothetical protein